MGPLLRKPIVIHFILAFSRVLVIYGLAFIHLHNYCIHMDKNAKDFCKSFKSEIAYHHFISEHHPLCWLIVLGALYNQFIVSNSLWKTISLCCPTLHHPLGSPGWIRAMHPIFELLDVNVPKINIPYIFPPTQNLRVPQHSLIIVIHLVQLVGILNFGHLRCAWCLRCPGRVNHLRRHLRCAPLHRLRWVFQ